MTPQEETVILEAREILGRYLNQNPVLSSWQAVRDYCALTVRGGEERFHVLYLDRKNRIISDELLAVGTVDMSRSTPARSSSGRCCSMPARSS